MVNISWKKKLAKEGVLQMDGENRRSFYTSREGKYNIFVNVMRLNELPRVIIEGKVEGKKVKDDREKCI